MNLSFKIFADFMAMRVKLTKYLQLDTDQAGARQPSVQQVETRHDENNEENETARNNENNQAVASKLVPKAKPVPVLHPLPKDFSIPEELLDADLKHALTRDIAPNESHKKKVVDLLYYHIQHNCGM